MKVGIQLYSVRDRMEQDPLATIRQVAEQGYRYLEVANHNAEEDHGVGFHVSPAEIRKVLDETGASVVSAHIFPMDATRIQPVLDYHSQIGTRFIVMPMDFYKNAEETLQKAEILNQVGQACKDAGMELLYHNHFHEFQTFPGEKKTVYEIMMEHTDPELVKIEIDTYWAMRGGIDPVTFIKQYGKRVRLIHQKDYPKGMDAQINLLANTQPDTNIDIDYFHSVVKPEAFTEIGNGIMPIQSIIDAGNQYGDIAYIILEQDFSTHDELESIQISMENFKALQGIAWE